MTEGNNSSVGLQNRSLTDLDRFSSLEDIDVTADGTPILRVFICVVYSVVCAVGLVGNLLVLFFIRVKQERKKSRINFFVLNLAVTDFQFVLTLPFWAVDTALDFSWPFGDAMCKIISSVTVMNMYASVFFLTAMSVTRYWSVASSLKDRTRQKSCSAKWISVVLWVSATIATAPTSIFSTVTNVAGEKLFYHLQKIIFAFVLPMAIVSVSYIMLLRFIRNLHTYVFPVTVCLAHANSCLNPVIYCLMREEFRKKLKDLLYVCSVGGKKITKLAWTSTKTNGHNDAMIMATKIAHEAILPLMVPPIHVLLYSREVIIKR
uniref:G-protein coupled receptors family 1 profile domain-containing protein n=1 Tax=Oncorhynchus kisutch TaxID=8019 RepID=A0A8C7JKD1_ONCKI